MLSKTNWLFESSNCPSSRLAGSIALYGVFLPRSVLEHSSHFPSRVFPHLLVLATFLSALGGTGRGRQRFCAGSTHCCVTTCSFSHHFPVTGLMEPCLVPAQLSPASSIPRPPTATNLRPRGTRGARCSAGLFHCVPSDYYHRIPFSPPSLAVRLFQPKYSLLPHWFVPQLPGAGADSRAKKKSPGRRQTSRVKEAISRALWDSPHHVLPLAIALYPSLQGETVPVQKNTHLEARASFKQALRARGAATGVPQLRCRVLGRTGDWWGRLHGWHILAFALLAGSQIQLYQPSRTASSLGAHGAGGTVGSCCPTSSHKSWGRSKSCGARAAGASPGWAEAQSERASAQGRKA